MNEDFSSLRDPDSQTALRLRSGELTGEDRSYPIINGIPRFVESKNYAGDFGLQWNKFGRTQLDSHTGTKLTEDRLARCLNGHLEQLAGKMVLEAGSGAGRFTEVLLQREAIVHSFDFSSAVEANQANNGLSSNLTLVQADIRKIPFPKSSYDYVVCLGVLQHTPNPEESISSLYDMVKPGGHLVFDHYIFRWRNVLPPPIGGAEALYRRFVLALPQKRRLGTAKKIVDFWFPLHWKYRDSLAVQRILRRLSPVHFYYPHHELRDKNMYYEWALLDTHDGTTDFYKHLRSTAQIEKFLGALGATDIVVREGGNGVEASCKKPE